MLLEFRVLFIFEVSAIFLFQSRWTKLIRVNISSCKVYVSSCFDKMRNVFIKKIFHSFISLSWKIHFAITCAVAAPDTLPHDCKKYTWLTHFKCFQVKLCLFLNREWSSSQSGWIIIATWIDSNQVYFQSINSLLAQENRNKFVLGTEWRQTNQNSTNDDITFWKIHLIATLVPLQRLSMFLSSYHRLIPFTPKYIHDMV